MTTMFTAMRRAAELPVSVGVRFHSSSDTCVSASFAELDRQARKDAALIRAAGWQPGERVLLMFNAGMEFVRALYAAFYAGLVAVPVPVTVSRDPEAIRNRIVAIAADCGAGLVFTTHITSASLGTLGQQLVLHFFDDVDEHADHRWTDPRVKHSDIAVIQYTSGSTGTPKGVMVSHGNLVANQKAIAGATGTGPGSVLVGWLPHYHDMGLGMFMQAIYGGFNLVFTSPTQFLRRPVIWLHLLSTYKATVTVAPNFAYDLCTRLVKELEFPDLDLSHLRTMIVGAEPIRFETLENFRLRFSNCGLSTTAFVPAYGMAETTLLVTCKEAGRPVRVLRIDADELELGRAKPVRDGRAVDLVSCGMPAPGHDLVIVDTVTGESLPPNQVGEIWISGPSVTQGYWGREEATFASFMAQIPNNRASYLRTGDLGFISDGELIVTGRLKDLIIVNGRNVEPHDLELECARLLDSPAECVQAAFELQAGGVIVVAEVSAKDPDISADQVRNVWERIAGSFSLPSLGIALVHRGAIPRTSSGKVRRSETRLLFTSEKLNIVQSAGPISSPGFREMIAS